MAVSVPSRGLSYLNEVSVVFYTVDKQYVSVPYRGLSYLNYN